MNTRYLIFAATLVALNVNADNSTLDAAIGGGIGGATGAAIGNELGGRDGAILGGTLGAAIGTAVTTDGNLQHKSTGKKTYYRSNEKNSMQFCPPGQAKKGRC
jgi:outer membrane lipoprotein SlyB